MTDNRFFNFIWRVNALLVLFVGFAIVWELTGESIRHTIADLTRKPRPTPVVDTTVKLGRPVLVGNGAYYLYPLSAGGGHRDRNGYSSKPIRNFLVVDTETNESTWMFPTSDRHIIRWEELTREADCGFESIGVELTEIREDTNGDGKLNWGDRSTRLVAAGFDKQPRDIVGLPVDVFWCEEQGGHLFCDFVTANGRETAIYALDDEMTELSRMRLPDPPGPTPEKDATDG